MTTSRRQLAKDGFWERSARPIVLLFPLPFILSAVIWMDLALQVQLSLLILAGTLCVLAGIGLLAQHQAQARQKMLVDAVPLLVSKDVNPAFLATADAVVTYANHAAEARFTHPVDDSIGSRLAKVIANPDVLIYRLQKKAITLAAAREDVTTRKGKYLSLIHI